jgi:hypothetical protein
MSTTVNPTMDSAQNPKSNIYPRGQAVFGICALVVLLLIFNYYPQRVGFWVSATDGLSFLPILSPAFFEQYLPWINLCWVLALGLNIAHLSLGRWTLATRLLDLALAFLALNVVVAMIFGPAILAVGAQAASMDGAWTTTAQVVATALSMVTPFVLGVIALALVIDMIKKVVDLVRSISP